jgi:hypothetical protein
MYSYFFQDAPGFSGSDLYHMKALRDCLLDKKCHALVHVVNNRAMPKDCDSILRDAGRSYLIHLLWF